MAEAVAASQDDQYEVVTVSLSSDGQLSGFAPAGGDPPPTVIQCIRPREGYRFMLIPPFGPSCAEEIDLPLIQEMRQVRHHHRPWTRSHALVSLLAFTVASWCSSRARVSNVDSLRAASCDTVHSLECDSAVAAGRAVAEKLRTQCLSWKAKLPAHVLRVAGRIPTDGAILCPRQGLRPNRSC